MNRNSLFTALVLFAALLTGRPAEAAVRYPDPHENGVTWLYCFGKDGDLWYGADPEPKSYYVVVPKGSGSVTIRVLDADTTGAYDERDATWDTGTLFTVYGGEQQLVSETVSVDATDGTVLTLGPFEAGQGEDRGDHHLFRVVVEGLEGDDNNLFAFEVEPDSAQMFSYNFSFRLAAHEGERMSFYPEIPAGMTVIQVGNHDIDPSGGKASFIAPASTRGWFGLRKQLIYPVRNSASAQWAWTTLTLPEELTGTRWTYRIVKETQKEANASIEVKDANGQLLPTYFTLGEMVSIPESEPLPPPAPKAPLGACNTFEFDGSESYDPDNQALTYHWDFGDGETADVIRIRHTYASGGIYKVVLNVSDTSTGECRTSTIERVLHVNAPPKAALSAPGSACVGDSIRVSAAGSSDNAGDTLSYRWDFGDGSGGDGMEATHAYARGGTFNIGLLVDDNRNTSCSIARATGTIRVNSPPVAKGPESVRMCLEDPSRELAVAFDGSGSKDPDEDDLTYHWDFGDGSTGEGARVSHTYERGGRYTSTLTVDDNAGTDCSVSQIRIPVQLNRAPLIPKGETVTACNGESVTLSAEGASDLDGDTLSYRWDLGDGSTAEGATVEHRYSQGGTYPVTLTVDDGSGMECSSASTQYTAKVNSQPQALIQAPQRACAGETLSFSAGDSDDPDGQKLAYSWDFGDGTAGQGSRVSHAYRTGGEYRVTLSVDDGQETPCSTSSARATVQVNTPPIANAGQNTICCSGDINVFDASKSSDADGDTLSYRWDFGDGATAEGVRVQHAYEKIGTYPVSVIVDDGTGTECSTATAGFVAEVNASPVAQMIIRDEKGEQSGPGE